MEQGLGGPPVPFLVTVTLQGGREACHVLLSHDDLAATGRPRQVSATAEPPATGPNVLTDAGATSPTRFYRIRWRDHPRLLDQGAGRR